MVVEVEESVDVGDGDPFRPRRHLDDGVAGLDRSLGQDPHVETRPPVRDEERRQARLIEADADPVARHAGLRHLEQGAPDAVAVADPHLVVGQPVHREVLAERAIGEIGTAQMGLPVPVRVELVHEHGSVLAAMARQVALAVAVDVQPAHHTTALDRPLPDPRVDGRVPPWHVDRQTDIDGHQRRHGTRHSATLGREGGLGHSRRSIGPGARIRRASRERPPDRNTGCRPHSQDGHGRRAPDPSPRARRRADGRPPRGRGHRQRGDLSPASAATTDGGPTICGSGRPTTSSSLPG